MSESVSGVSSMWRASSRPMRLMRRSRSAWSEDDTERLLDLEGVSLRALYLERAVHGSSCSASTPPATKAARAHGPSTGWA